MKGLPTPAKTYGEQIASLRSRGMAIDDPEAATGVLMHLNYHRFRLYAHVFRMPECANYRPGTSFDEVKTLYDFDQQLRGLVLASIKVIEVSIRSRLAYVLSHSLGPLSHLDPDNYRRPGQAASTLASIEREVARGRPYQLLADGGDGVPFDRLPIWAAVESFSFGNTSKLLANLASASLRNRIAATYGLGDPVLVAALYHINVARNLAAHHARLWNATIREKLLVPNYEPAALRLTLVVGIAAPGCHNTLVMIAYLVRKIDPSSRLPSLLRAHLRLLPRPLQAAAGIPDEWEKLPLWAGIDIPQDYP